MTQSQSGQHMPEGAFLFERNMIVRWGDMDAMGHVNNIMYFRYFEHVRLHWFESLGNDPIAAGNQNGMVIVDNHAEYIVPVVYPAELTIRMGGHSPGRSSFISTYTVCQGETLMTRGRAKVVWIDSTVMKSVPLPDQVRALLPTAES